MVGRDDAIYNEIAQYLATPATTTWTVPMQKNVVKYLYKTKGRGQTTMVPQRMQVLPTCADSPRTPTRWGAHTSTAPQRQSHHTTPHKHSPRTPVTILHVQSVLSEGRGAHCVHLHVLAIH